MGYWQVNHMEHDSTPLGSYQPMNTAIHLEHKAVSTLAYDIALSNPTLSRDEFAPLRTDWNLTRDGVIILGGFHTAANLKSDEGVIHVGGKDWMHWLEGQPFPFDSDFPLTQWGLIDNPTVDISQIVRDLLDSVTTGTYDLPLLYTIPDVGIKGYYYINHPDETSILDHLLALANQDENFGFDFDIRQSDKTFRYYHPKKDDGTILYTFADSSTIIDLDWTNNGPLATRTTGFSQPFADTYFHVSEYIPSDIVYRRWSRYITLDNAYDQDATNRKTNAQRNHDRAPQHLLNMTIRTENINGFWTDVTAKLGKRIWVTYDFEPYHKIDAPYKILTIDVNPSNEGDELVVLGIERIYEDAA